MTKRAISHLAEAVHDRSGGRCEAVWHLGYRCPNPGDELAHRLPRSRARIGDEHLLDLEALHHGGDVEHLADLCRPCHHAAEADQRRAYAAWVSGPHGSIARSMLRQGISIPGTITRHPAGVLVYTGPDPTFAARYPSPGAHP